MLPLINYHHFVLVINKKIFLVIKKHLFGQLFIDNIKRFFFIITNKKLSKCTIRYVKSNKNNI